MEGCINGRETEEERKRSEGRKERKKKGRKEGIKITHGTVFYDNFKKIISYSTWHIVRINSKYHCYC